MDFDDRPTIAAPDEDPYLWLEDIEGERALAFVERQNRLTLEKLGGAGFARDRDLLAAIYDRPDNIPYVTRRGGRLYNLWKDANNPRGIWRRTTLEEFRKPSPEWEILLDLDRLAADENKDWLLAGTLMLPGNDSRAILSLSRGVVSFCRRQRAAPHGSMPIRCCCRARMAKTWRRPPATPEPSGCGGAAWT